MRVVVETRTATYPERAHVNRVRRNRKEKWVDDPGGHGVEIVRELTVCGECARSQED